MRQAVDLKSILAHGEELMKKPKLLRLVQGNWPQTDEDPLGHGAFLLACEALHVQAQEVRKLKTCGTPGCYCKGGNLTTFG